MAASDSERNVHWYCMIDGKQQGPMIASRLRQMAREGTLSAGSLVRKGTTGDWVAAGTIDELRVRLQVVVKRTSNSDPDPPVIQKAGRLEEWRCGVSDLMSSAIGNIADRLGIIRTIAGYTILTVVLLCLIKTIVNRNVFVWTVQADPLETYQTRG